MPDRLSAIHESGHAVAAYLLGGFPERVFIRSEGDSVGHVAYLSVVAEQIARAALVGTRDIDQEVVMRFLIASAAGPVAQAKAMNGVHSYPFPWTTFGGFADHGIATRLMTAAGDLLDTSLDDLVDDAGYLLTARWDAVERVANELMRHKEIGFEELRFAVLGFTEEERHDDAGLSGQVAA